MFKKSKPVENNLCVIMHILLQKEPNLKKNYIYSRTCIQTPYIEEYQLIHCI